MVATLYKVASVRTAGTARRALHAHRWHGRFGPRPWRAVLRRTTARSRSKKSRTSSGSGRSAGSVARSGPTYAGRPQPHTAAERARRACAGGDPAVVADQGQQAGEAAVHRHDRLCPLRHDGRAHVGAHRGPATAEQEGPARQAPPEHSLRAHGRGGHVRSPCGVAAALPSCCRRVARWRPPAVLRLIQPWRSGHALVRASRSSNSLFDNLSDASGVTFTAEDETALETASIADADEPADKYQYGPGGRRLVPPRASARPLAPTKGDVGSARAPSTAGRATPLRATGRRTCRRSPRSRPRGPSRDGALRTRW